MIKLPSVPRNLPHDYIIVHCSATRATDTHVDAAWIDRLHKSFNWAGIGYHFVILRNGTIETGRNFFRSDGSVRNAAHVGDCGYGWNKRSIGICLAGGVAADGRTPEFNYTPEQMASLKALLELLWNEAKKTSMHDRTIGHRDLIKRTGAPAKACPVFSVQSQLDAWYNNIELEKVIEQRDNHRINFGIDVARERDDQSKIHRLAPAIHVVKPGDTLGMISNIYGVPIYHLAQLNGIANINLIYPNQKIKLR